jgi:hypothetical protein
MYGLNLPPFFMIIDLNWRTSILERSDEYDDTGDAKSLESLRAQKLLDILISYLEAFKPAFEHIDMQKCSVKDVGAFRDQLEKILPDGNTCSRLEDRLKDGIRNARVRIRDLKPAKWKDLAE